MVGVIGGSGIGGVIGFCVGLCVNFIFVLFCMMVIFGL